MFSPSTPSRRAVLAGIGSGLAASVAGCSGSESRQSPPADGAIVTDHAAVMTRSTSDRPPIVAPRESTDTDESADDTASDPLTSHVIGSESGSEAVAFAGDATNVAAVRRLISETAYASESVLLYQTRVRDCYTLQLNYVARDDDGSPDVQFCHVIRDAEVDCERDAWDHVAAAVRLPFPDDEYSGLSIGTGGSCGRIPSRYNESEPA